MQGCPSATNVGSGSFATLTALPESSLTRSVLLLHTAIFGAVVGSDMLQVGLQTCMVCLCNVSTSALITVCFCFYPLLFVCCCQTCIPKSDCLALLQ